MKKLGVAPSVILIVEDDEAAQLMMSTTLEEAGFDVLVASDCGTARGIFETQIPDLILMDVLLPDGDGFSLCTEFKQQTKGRDIPIAMVTGLDDLDSIRCGYKCGATDFITKPVSWGTLPYRIDYLLQASKALVDLSVSESKTRALLSSIPDIIMRVQGDGRVVDMQVGSYVFDMEAWVTYEVGKSYGCLPDQVMKLIEQPLAKVLAGEGMQLVEFQWSQEVSRIRF